MRSKVAWMPVLAWVAAAAAAAEPSPFSRMGWMEGRWIGVVDGTRMEEHWTSGDGDALVGMHKDVKDGRMVSFEFLRIERRDGEIHYLASPGGRPATPFKLVEQSDRRLVFENPAHDFPQRVLYWSDRAGTLSARIEGTIDGRAESMEWRWKRASR
jgi:hypothetical protein